MSITNLIDFEEAFCLLGLYEQRYAQTGEFSYLTGGVEDDLLPVVFMPSEPVAENVLLTEDAPNEEELMSEQEESWQSHQEIPSEESEKILPTGNSEMEKPQTIFFTSISTLALEILDGKAHLPVPSDVVRVQDESDSSEAEIIKPDEPDDIGLPLSSQSEKEKLLLQQEEEKRLFYLFVEEIEKTGDLTLLPSIFLSEY